MSVVSLGSPTLSAQLVAILLVTSASKACQLPSRMWESQCSVGYADGRLSRLQPASQSSQRMHSSQPSATQLSVSFTAIHLGAPSKT